MDDAKQPFDKEANTAPSAEENGGENNSSRDQRAANTDITLSQAQQTVDRWIKEIGVRYFSELTNLAQLVEEVGELSRIMSRTYGDQSFKESDEGHSLSDELADVLFVIICIANQTGVDLTAALSKNLEKKTQRDSERHKNNPKLQ